MTEWRAKKANPDQAAEENPAQGSTRGRLLRPLPLLRRVAGLLIPPAPDDSAPTQASRLRRLAARLRSRRLLPLYLVLAVNALLLAAYCWSAGGATMHVRIQAIDGVYTVFVDGKRQVEARCELFSDGSVVVRLPLENEIGSLPRPRGLDRLVVTDADSGTVLYSNDSSAAPDNGWTQTGDRWNVLNVGDSSWRNYTVDAYFKNINQASVMVHSMADQKNGIVYAFRPFRHFDNGLDLLEDGKTAKCPVTWVSSEEDGLQAVGEVRAPGLELSKAETLKSMLAMLLRPYPLVVVALFGLLVAVVVLQLAGLEKLLRRLRSPPASSWARVLIPVIAAATLGVLIYISRNVNQGVPHVPDEVSYVFQAKILASFHLTTPIPPVKEAFDFFYPSLLFDSGGRWASVYPFGHPVMLAIGQLVGAIWLIPPLLGALCVVLIYAVGRQIHSVQVGIAAALLLAFSPFFQMTASNLMSHNTAAFYILACLFLIGVNWRSKARAYGLAGVCFGLVLNTRPMTAAALVLPFALLFLYDFLSGRGQRLAIARRSVAFAAGVLLMVGAFYLYNLGTTGSLSPGYGSNAQLETVLGFGEKNSLARGIQNEQTQLATLLLVFNGWPLFIGLALVLLPFILGSRSHRDLFLLIAAVFTVGVWTAYEGSGIIHGPRYWYESMPFIVLLSARGFTLLGERVACWAGLVGRRGAGREEPIAVARVLSYGILAVLLGISVHGWVLGRHYDAPRIDYVPRAIEDLKGFNGADDRLSQKVKEMDLHNALVLVKACTNWQCYGTVFWRNDPDFNGDVVYARDLSPERTAAVIASYPDRQVYLADYGASSVVPYEPISEPPRAQGPDTDATCPGRQMAHGGCPAASEALVCSR